MSRSLISDWADHEMCGGLSMTSVKVILILGHKVKGFSMAVWSKVAVFMDSGLAY